MKKQPKRDRKPKIEIVTVEISPPPSLKVVGNQSLRLRLQKARPLPILKLIQYPIPRMEVNHHG